MILTYSSRNRTAGPSSVSTTSTSEPTTLPPRASTMFSELPLVPVCHTDRVARDDHHRHDGAPVLQVEHESAHQRPGPPSSPAVGIAGLVAALLVQLAFF